MNSLKQLFSKFRFTLVGIILGLAMGYLYYAQIGCEDGCTITGSPVNSTLYGGLMGGLLLSMIDDHLKKIPHMNAQELILAGKGTIVDVRSHLEFSGGSVADSINVPLDQLNHQLEKLRSLKAPLILVCASGNRSGMAQNFLAENNIDCLNGGSWLNVNYFLSLREDKN